MITQIFTNGLPGPEEIRAALDGTAHRTRCFTQNFKYLFDRRSPLNRPVAS